MSRTKGAGEDGRGRREASKWYFVAIRVLIIILIIVITIIILVVVEISGHGKVAAPSGVLSSKLQHHNPDNRALENTKITDALSWKRKNGDFCRRVRWMLSYSGSDEGINLTNFQRIKERDRFSIMCVYV